MAGDERTQGVGPAFAKDANICDGRFKVLSTGIHSAENELILQHDVAH